MSRWFHAYFYVPILTEPSPGGRAGGPRAIEPNSPRVGRANEAIRPHQIRANEPIPAEMADQPAEDRGEIAQTKPIFTISSQSSIRLRMDLPIARMIPKRRTARFG